MKEFNYETCCVDAKGKDIQEMVDIGRQITYNTVKKHCDLSVFDNIYQGCPQLSLGKDYAVSFYKSKFQGRSCYFVEHSAIEHIFTQEA